MRAGLTARIALLIVSLLVCVALGELALRIIEAPRRPVAGWRTQIPPEEFDSIDASDKNQLGLRGRRFEAAEGERVVLLIGDSQVEAKIMPFAEMPERLLEHYLNALADPGEPRYRVFSIGAGAWGQDQQSLALDEYLSLGLPVHHAVAWITWDNDLYDVTWPTRFPAGHAKPTFWLEDGELRGPNVAMDEDLTGSRIVELLSRVFLGSLDDRWARRLPEPYRPRTTYEGPVDSTWQELADAGRLPDDFSAERARGTIDLTPRSARTTYSLDLMRALLSRMQASLAARGAGLTVFSARRLLPGPRDSESVIASVRRAEAASGSIVMELDGRFRHRPRRIAAFRSPRRR